MPQAPGLHLQAGFCTCNDPTAELRLQTLRASSFFMKPIQSSHCALDWPVCRSRSTRTPVSLPVMYRDLLVPVCYCFCLKRNLLFQPYKGLQQKLKKNSLTPHPQPCACFLCCVWAYFTGSLSEKTNATGHLSFSQVSSKCTLCADWKVRTCDPQKNTTQQALV